MAAKKNRREMTHAVHPDDVKDEAGKAAVRKSLTDAIVDEVERERERQKRDGDT